MMALLEGGYRLFLPARPALSQAFGRVQAWRREGPRVLNRRDI